MATVIQPSERAETLLLSLEEELRGLGNLLVCYSGGVDSALVLAAAHKVLGPKAVGMTAVSPSLARDDLSEALSLAKQIGADHRVVESYEIESADYVKNAPDRCFHCKSELYRIASIKAAEWGFEHIANGTNLDDLGDYRPGLEAAREASVVSPLVKLGFRKEDVREVAQLLGLPAWNRPASACLSSRIPYGTSVTRERLSMIESLEAKLRALGFRQLRVRYHALAASVGAAETQALARVEVESSELARASEPAIAAAIVAAGKSAGFLYVTLDLQGYRTGSHNEVLRPRSLPVVS